MPFMVEVEHTACIFAVGGWDAEEVKGVLAELVRVGSKTDVNSSRREAEGDNARCWTPSLAHDDGGANKFRARAGRYLRRFDCVM